MNSDVMDELNLSEDVRGFERRFCEFYFGCALQFLRHEKSSIIKSVSLVFGIQDTCIAFRMFYASLMENKDIAKHLSSKNPVRIYCLRGESILAAVGICIAIDEVFEQCTHSYQRNIKQIQVTINEERLDWRSVYSNIVEKINSYYKNVQIKLEHVGHFQNRLSDEVIREVNEADILVMTNFLSKFQHLTVKTIYLEVILKKMKEHAILFYLDQYHEKYSDTLKYFTSKTDFLNEIRSSETVFELPEYLRTKENYLKFPLLQRITFPRVMYSICTKYPGMNITDYDKKATPSLPDSKREVSLSNSKKIEKEISICTSPSPAYETEILAIPSKCTSNASAVKTTQIIASGENSIIEPSKESNNAITSSFTTQIPCKDNKMKFSKYSSAGNVPLVSIKAFAPEAENEPNIHTFKKSKVKEKNSPTRQYNEYEYSEQKDNLYSETNKPVGNTITTCLQDKSKFFVKVNKLNTETVKTRNVVELIQNIASRENNTTEPSKEFDNAMTSSLTTQIPCKDNKMIFSKYGSAGNVFLKSIKSLAPDQENKPNIQTFNKSKVKKKNAPTSQHNKDKYSELKGKPKVEKSKPVGKLVATRLQGKSKFSVKENKTNAETVKTREVYFKPATYILQKKNKYPQNENILNTKAGKKENVNEKLVSTNLQKKNKYSEKENKKNPKTFKSFKVLEKLVFKNIQSKNKYHKAIFNFDSSNLLSKEKYSGKFSSSNQQSKEKKFNEGNKPNTKTAKTSKVVGKLASSNQHSRKKYSKKQTKRMALKRTEMIRDALKLAFADLQKMYKFFEEQDNLNAETVNTKNIGKSASTEKQNKNKCCRARIELRTKPNTQNFNRKKFPRKLEPPELQNKNKYKKHRLMEYELFLSNQMHFDDRI